MTAETITPNALKDIYSRYRELAPSPDPEGTGIAWNLSRYLLVNAIRANARAEHEVLNGGGPSTAALAELHGCFAAVHVLESQRISAMRGPAVPAAEIAEAIRDGGGIGEWLWDHARHLGIDINEVTRLAGAEARLKAEAQVNAATARRLAGDLFEQARDRARECERVMYAAVIDLGDGDHNDALINLREELEGVQFAEDWDGVESGTEWLERTAPQSPAAHPGPAELWQQAGGDRGEYMRLMREHGHVVRPGDTGYEPDAPKTVACGWEPGRQAPDKPGSDESPCPIYRPLADGSRLPCTLPESHNDPEDAQRSVHVDSNGDTFRVARCQQPGAHGMPHAWCAIPEHHLPIDGEARQ